MGAADHGNRRRRLWAGAVGALGIGLALVPVLGAGDSNAADPVERRPAARPPVAVERAAAVIPELPAADPALAAAVWDAEHPPPPPPLPVPAAMPDPGAYRPLTEIARIQIPKTGVDDVVREGIEQMVIDAGPAHWPGTPLPGGWGNLVLAGHRSIHTAPFYRNAELVPGDEIVLSDLTGGYHYRVTQVMVVDDTALWIVDQHEGRTLTIFTCHPIGSSAQRLVVQAELVSRARPDA